jgi:SAM-dependent methyltransferase
MSYYKQQLEDYLSKLNIKADKVLDIGGGARPVRDRVKSWGVNDYLIFDNGAEGNFGNVLFDLNYPIINGSGGSKYSGLVTDLIGNIDIIFCLEVFEYIYDPMTAMRNINLLLREGGKAYISFPFQYPLHKPDDIDYLRYTKYGVNKLVKENGFQMNKLISRVATEGKDDLFFFYRHEKMHPLKETEDIFDIGYIIEIEKL